MIVSASVWLASCYVLCSSYFPALVYLIGNECISRAFHMDARSHDVGIIPYVTVLWKNQQGKSGTDAEQPPCHCGTQTYNHILYITLP